MSQDKPPAKKSGTSAAKKAAAKKAAAPKAAAGSVEDGPDAPSTPAVTARRPISKEEYARTTKDTPDSTAVIPAISDDAGPVTPEDVATVPAKDSTPQQKDAAPAPPAPSPPAAPVAAARTPGAVTAPVAPSVPTVPVPDEAPTTVAPTVTPATGSGRVQRRAVRRKMTYIEPWSVTKMAFVVSVALMIVSVVAVVVFWFVLQVTGVWQALNDSVANVLSDGSANFDVTDYVGLARLTGFALVASALNVVFLTALATISAHAYNLAASFMGGVEVTFQERD